MLPNISADIAECCRRAATCRRRALEIIDPIYRDHVLEIEQHWLALASSYEAAQQIAIPALSHEVEVGGMQAR